MGDTQGPLETPRFPVGPGKKPTLRTVPRDASHPSLRAPAQGDSNLGALATRSGKYAARMPQIAVTGGDWEVEAMEGVDPVQPLLPAPMRASV